LTGSGRPESIARTAARPSSHVDGDKVLLPKATSCNAKQRSCGSYNDAMVTTLILIVGGVLLAALAVIYFSVVRRGRRRT
jgi:hypothetical protein